MIRSQFPLLQSPVSFTQQQITNLVLLFFSLRPRFLFAQSFAHLPSSERAANEQENRASASLNLAARFSVFVRDRFVGRKSTCFHLNVQRRMCISICFARGRRGKCCRLSPFVVAAQQASEHYQGHVPVWTAARGEMYVLVCTHG